MAERGRGRIAGWGMRRGRGAAQQNAHLGEDANPAPDVLSQLAAAIAQHSQGQAVERPNLDTFMRQGPRDFKNAKDPIEAEEWIADMEKIFAVIDASDRQKVQWAVYRLTGDAQQWWGTVTRTKSREQLEGMNWNQFKELFLNKYFPRAIKRKMEGEFLRIQQGEDEPVMLYEQRFTRLSRFAPNMVTEEEDKANRFLEGLKPSLQWALASQNLQTYELAVDTALQLETKRNRLQEIKEANLSQQKRKQGGNKGESSANKKNKTAEIPQCHKCGKVHKGECLAGTGTCYRCGKWGHMAKDCRGGERLQQGQRSQPEQSGQKPVICFNCGEPGHKSYACSKPKKNWQGGRAPQQQQQGRAPARAYAMAGEETEPSTDVVTGTILICDRKCKALFDTGSTHSFVSTMYAPHLTAQSQCLANELAVDTPGGSVLIANKVYRNCSIELCGKKLLVDLIPLTITGYDVILGMDWLSANHAKVECRRKRVEFRLPGQKKFVYHGERVKENRRFLSVMQAKKLLRKGCEAYLAYVIGMDKETTKVEDIAVVRDFQDVFPKDLPGMPPEREVEFTIELAPGTAPISKAPYRMAPVELKELKEQLQDLLDKGFIRPSVR